MRRIIRTTCWLIIGVGLAPGLALSAEPDGKLQGAWTATRAEVDGKGDNNVVGHRLFFASNRFRIQSKDGKPLYEGTVRTDRSATPSAIDFEHTGGTLANKVWKGIYRLDGDALAICDNAPNLDKPRPGTFSSKAGAGDECVTFARAMP
jgi:uncharacterized protein (TIGR03067 family)